MGNKLSRCSSMNSDHTYKKKSKNIGINKKSPNYHWRPPTPPKKTTENIISQHKNDSNHKN